MRFNGNLNVHYVPGFELGGLNLLGFICLHQPHLVTYEMDSVSTGSKAQAQRSGVVLPRNGGARL